MTVYNDDFNRANGALTTPWLLSQFAGSSMPQIVGNRVQPVLNDLNYGAVLPAAATTKVFAQALAEHSSTAGYSHLGVVFEDPSGNGYAFFWLMDAGANVYRMFRATGASGATQMGPDVAASGITPRTMLIERDNAAGTVRGLVDGVQVMAFTGETVYTPNRPGFFVLQGGGASLPSIDDFTGGDIPVGVPGAPTGLTTTQTAASTAALSWTAPSSDGGAITGYLIERAPNSGGSPGTWATLVANTGSAATTYSDTTATGAPVTYWYRVSAINANGTGAASTAASVAMAAAPSMPDAPVIDSAWNGAIHAYLAVAPADNGSPITDYTWEYATSSGGPWTTVTDTVSASREVNVSELTDGTPYYVRVTAKNGLSSSPSAASAPRAPAFLGDNLRITPSLALLAAPSNPVRLIGPPGALLTYDAAIGPGGFRYVYSRGSAEATVANPWVIPWVHGGYTNGGSDMVEDTHISGLFERLLIAAAGKVVIIGFDDGQGGTSVFNPGTYTNGMSFGNDVVLGRMANAIAWAKARYGIERVIVSGFSAGGMAPPNYAYRNFDDVAGVLLFDPVVGADWITNNDSWGALWEADLDTTYGDWDAVKAERDPIALADASAPMRSIPMLMFIAGADPTITDTGQDLFTAAWGANGTQVDVNTGDHFSFHDSVDEDTVLAWLDDLGTAPGVRLSYDESIAPGGFRFVYTEGGVEATVADPWVIPWVHGGYYSPGSHMIEHEAIYSMWERVLLAAQGQVVVVGFHDGQGGSSAWFGGDYDNGMSLGNDVVLARMSTAVTWAKAEYGVTKVVATAFSAGGMGAVNWAYRHLADTAGVLLFDCMVGVDWMVTTQSFGPDLELDLDEIYGDWGSVKAVRDPTALATASAPLRAIPMRLYVATGDAVDAGDGVFMTAWGANGTRLIFPSSHEGIHDFVDEDELLTWLATLDFG